MNRPIAEKINDLMLEFSQRLDESIRLVMETSSPEEFNHYRQAAGKIMGEIFVEILTPIYKEHPALTPDALKKNDV